MRCFAWSLLLFAGGAAWADPPSWVTPAVNAERLAHRTFESAAANATVSYHIYLPEAYDTDPERRFPVVYWLHGSGGGLAGLPRLTRYFDQAVRAGLMPPALVVFPNGMRLSLWVDSKDGRVPMETVVIKELVPHIDATFRTIAGREGRLVEGFSMGGYGAARFGFRYHDRFAAVSILSGGPLQQVLTQTPLLGLPGREHVLQEVFGGDQEYFRAQSPWVLAEQHAEALRGGTRLRLVIGQRDPMLPVVRAFEAHLTELEIPHIYTELPEVGHDPQAVLAALGEASWEFYRAALGR